MKRETENFAADIPKPLHEADQLLTDYGRWATSHGRGSRPATLDRMYIREADRKESLEAFLRRRAYVPPEPMMPVLQALTVQRALTRVPDRERVVLATLYVPQRLPIAAQLRILRIPPQLCRVRHMEGLRMFLNLYKVACLSTPLQPSSQLRYTRAHLTTEDSAAAA